MIRLLLLGCARAAFNLAAVVLLLGGLLLYAAFRLARAAVARDAGQPRREAAFALLLAGLAFARSLPPTKTP